LEARREAARLDQQGREHAGKENFKEALAMMNRAIEINPRYARAYNARGYVQLRLTNYSQALADFTEAIRLDPTYANAYHNRAVTRKLVGEMEGAKADERNAKKYSTAISLTASR
jgi:Flp pilus assembly protein TadD